MKDVALVTGSTRGIGQAIALQLAEEGYAVAINAREYSAEAQQTLQLLHKRGAEAAFFACDVSDFAAVERMQIKIADALGEVTALVNNAGFAHQVMLTDMMPADWRHMMSVHLDGAFHTCRVFLPPMIHAHAGSIVNISSMWGQTGGSCEVAYSAAKAGLIGMTKALAKEVGPAGVRVNCVAPGVVMTDMMRGYDVDTIRDLTDQTPLERLGTPRDIADAVCFLLSEKASFITGQVLAPNGGMVI